MKILLPLGLSVLISVSASTAFAETRERSATEALTRGCLDAGRTASQCECYLGVLQREMTPEEIEFYTDFMRRIQAAQDDPGLSPALAADVKSRRDYYREKMAPAAKASEVAMRECAEPAS